MRKKLLFIDDEGWFAKPYRERLEPDFEVVFLDDAEKALEYFRSDNTVLGVILDIMMPAPGIAAHVAAGGLDTGLWWLEEARAQLVERRVPVVVLTNRNKSHVEQRIAGLELATGLVEVRLKPETPAFFLPSCVKVLLQKWSQQ